MQRNVCIQALVFGLVAVSGCEPEELEVLGVFSLRSPEESRSWIVPDSVNQGGGPAQLGELRGRVNQARYAFGANRTAYLFTGNLRNGLGPFNDWVNGVRVHSGLYQALPAYDADNASVVEGGIPWMVVDTPAVAWPWGSFRVYDSGECSLLLDFENEQIPGLVPAFVPLVARKVDEVFAQCGKPETERFERVSDATVFPILRARPGHGGLGRDDDMIRYRATYRAPSVGGCAPVNVDIAFDMGLRSSPSGLTGVVDNVSAKVHGFCIVGGKIETEIRKRITEAIPDALPNAIRDRLLVDPRVVGLSSVPSCTQDSQCSNAWSWGSGHRCNDGECWIQVDAARANLRPEGLELVLFEDDEDPQRPLISEETPLGQVLEGQMCGPGRWSEVLHPTDSVVGQMTTTSVPVSLAISPPEFCE